ncbi:hypothetical protein GH714_014280 [Hevea brasiliensis]|uniref:RING-type domain-containing protein n=1 Tax=Hevea brasiliensis TaxID=3981 RepID=A0A6A6KKH6_HEVBR|nr:hypothetical protein GH714_014280 [Hevea brasiliensis]
MRAFSPEISFIKDDWVSDYGKQTVKASRKSLHHLGNSPNPYEQAISIIGRTLSDFDEDSLIPCYGFGDATTHDQEVFSFYPEDRPCNGFGRPTSFAPIIETAIGIVDNSGGQYHVLMIIADGQLSPQERSTIDAIGQASEHPLSIVLVGVGDGPWDMMHLMTIFLPGLSIISSCQRGIPKRYPLPPPLGNSLVNYNPKRKEPRSNEHRMGFDYDPSCRSVDHSSQSRSCPVCLWSKKDLALGCGHQTCYDCGRDLNLCPICQTYIITRIRLCE